MVLYQKAMTGFSPYSLPFWPALITLWRVIWIFRSGVVSTPFSNVGSSLLFESSAPSPALGENVCEELPPLVVAAVGAARAKQECEGNRGADERNQ